MSISLFLFFVLSLTFTRLGMVALRRYSPSRLERFGQSHNPEVLQKVVERGQATADSLRVLMLLLTIVFLGLLGAGLRQLPVDARWPWIDRLLLLALWLIGVQLLVPRLAERHFFEPFLYWTWPVLNVLHLSLTPLQRFMTVAGRSIAWLLAGRFVRRQAAVPSNGGLSCGPGDDEPRPHEPTSAMIEGLMELPEVTVSEIMTPRTDMIMLRRSDSIEHARQLINEHGHSRIPVYGENRDEVQGILYAKDLLPYLVSQSDHLKDLTTIELRRPVYVPESKPLDVLLREFQRERVHIAIVLDEYGGVAGLVTIEDILEQIVGEIADEYDQAEQPPIRQIDDRRVEVAARVHVDELNDLFDLGLPEDEDYETIGGFLFSAFGHVPKTGETIVHERVTLTVLDASERKIKRIAIELRSEVESLKVPPAID